MDKNCGFHPLKSLCTAFSLYSRIPVPKREVDEEGMRYALCFFPCVGVVIGLALILLKKAAMVFFSGSITFCCVGTALPLIITGGIHMDGFLDTADALSSFAVPEEKRRIMKDPHAGAFAFIWGAVYLLLNAAAFAELGAKAFPSIAGIYVLSRALSGFSAVSFKKTEGPGMLKSLSEGSDSLAVKISAAAWTAAAMILFFVTAGLIFMLSEAAAAFICLAVCVRLSLREFGGMNGDLAGFFLQVCELLLLIILAVFL